MTAAAAPTSGAGSEAAHSDWRRELTLALGWGSGIFLVTMLPYLVGYATTPPGKVFNGFFYLADDASTYIAKMGEGASGAWRWSDPYISSPVARPVFLFLFYILWGKVAAVFHLSLFATYHIARLSGAIVLVYAARRLAQACLPPGRARTVGVVLAIIGSGAGYLLAIVGAQLHRTSILGQPLEALDLHYPELSGFYGILAIPHFAWAAALMALTLVQLMAISRSVDVPARLRSSLLATLAMAALCTIHPQMLFVLAPLAVIYLALVRPRPQAWVLTAVPFILCLPLVAYYLRLLVSDPVIAQWSRQWRHQPPGVLAFVFALGLPLALALLALARGRGRGAPEIALLEAWLGLVILLLYLPNPVNIQRRLLDGIFLPLGLLAAVGLETLTAKTASARSRRRVASYGVALSAVSSLVVLSLGLAAAVAHQGDLYLDRSEAEAMAWLSVDAGSPPTPAVLSDPETGLFIPARSGNRVYAGHYSETLDSVARWRTARDEIRRGGSELTDFMRAQAVTYLFIGPRERASGVGPIEGLRPVYDRAGVRIYILGSR